ncbi:four helix bundle protein [Pontibacter russatus]|uniref:four helix bundle protein n=1 Tax=Pontibacter russatus TaxID=2694929 RepID=UPI00137A8F39|nr:four helix bundle protein [Pontibacter russatus]
MEEEQGLANRIYSLTKSFPKEGMFGLTSQMRRAAVPVASNIAEGCGRQHAKGAIQIFYIARGSLYELEKQLDIASDLDYINEAVLVDALKK